jgi:hypothetical protein
MGRELYINVRRGLILISGPSPERKEGQDEEEEDPVLKTIVMKIVVFGDVSSFSLVNV